MLRVFEFTINPEDSELGMSAISLVDKPAMESQFIAFNKDEVKPRYVKFQDEVKHIVAGLALIPDKLVFRIDEETGEEYFGYFSAQTIEMIMEKFMSDAEMGYTKNVNLQHESNNLVQAHLVESFILRTPEMVSAVQAMGIEEAVLGSWYVSYKFDNIEDYQTAVSGGFTGFSVEVMLQRELKLNKNNSNKNHNVIMAKVKSFIDKFKALLSEFEEVNFEDAVLADGSMTLRWGDVGMPVLVVSVDEAGAEVTAPAVAGEYMLQDGRTLVVDDMGNLSEIREAAAPVEPVVPEGLEDLAKYPWDRCISDRLGEGYSQDAADRICGWIKANNSAQEMELKDIIDAVNAEGGEPIVFIDGMPAVDAEGNPIVPEPVVPPTPDVASKTIGEIVDVTKNGKYKIEVEVMDGAIVSAYVEAEQNLVAVEDFNAKVSEIETLKNEIANLQAQLEKPIVKPAFTEFSTPAPKQLTKEEMKGLTTFEIVSKRLNLKK